MGQKIKCTCGDPACPTNIRVEDTEHIWMTGKNGEETLMYMDEDTLWALFKSIAEAVVEKAG